MSKNVDPVVSQRVNFLEHYSSTCALVSQPEACYEGDWNSHIESAPLSKSLIGDGLVDSPQITCRSMLQVFEEEKSLHQNTSSRICEEDGLGGLRIFYKRTQRQATQEEVGYLNAP